MLIPPNRILIGIYDDARREEHLHGPKHKARQMVFQHILPGARSQKLDNMASQKDDKSTRRAARSVNRGGSPWPRRQGMKDSQPAGQKKLPQQRLPRCGPPFGLGTGRVSLEPASDSWNGRSPRERSCTSLRPGQISARHDNFLLPAHLSSVPRPVRSPTPARPPSAVAARKTWRREWLETPGWVS